MARNMTRKRTRWLRIPAAIICRSDLFFLGHDHTPSHTPIESRVATAAANQLEQKVSKSAGNLLIKVKTQRKDQSRSLDQEVRKVHLLPLFYWRELWQLNKIHLDPD